MKSVTGKTLKIIAIVTMFIDHIGAAFLERYLVFLRSNGEVVAKTVVNSRHPGLWMDFMGNAALISNVDIVLRLIGRVSFPIFCFMLVEGFYHTHNVAAYLVRLLIFALLSEIPFDMAFLGGLSYRYQNVFLTLFIGIVFMYYADKVLENPHIFEVAAGFAFIPALIAGGLLGVECGTISFLIDAFFGEAQLPERTVFQIMVFIGAAAGAFLYFVLAKGWDRVKKAQAFGVITVLIITMVVAFVLNTDYNLVGVFTIAVMWLCRKNGMSNKDKALYGCIALFFMHHAECSCFACALPIARYNGEKGKYLKFIFYFFYPGHLLLLYGLRYMFIGR